MIALHVYEQLRCSGCGGNLSETTKAEHEGRYRVVQKIRCYQCDAIAEAAEQHQKAGAKHMHALRWVAKLMPPRRSRRG